MPHTQAHDELHKLVVAVDQMAASVTNRGEVQAVIVQELLRACLAGKRPSELEAALTDGGSRH